MITNEMDKTDFTCRVRKILSKEQGVSLCLSANGTGLPKKLKEMESENLVSNADIIPL